MVKECQQNGFPPLSLSFSLVSPINGILSLRRAEECKFLLVGQHWCIHEWESVEERRLWVRSYISSSAKCVLLIFREWSVLYTPPENSNEYVQFLINTLETRMRINGFMPFPRVLARKETQLASYKIWIWLSDSVIKFLSAFTLVQLLFCRLVAAVLSLDRLVYIFLVPLLLATPNSSAIGWTTQTYTYVHIFYLFTTTFILLDSRITERLEKSIRFFSGFSYWQKIR